MADDQKLLALASSVAEGSDLAWEQIERQTSDAGERSVIRELRVLAHIARTARTPPAVDPAAFTGPCTDALEMWGHLRLVDEIGRGSFGVVYRAWDTTLERNVALKLIEPRIGPAGLDTSRAVQEARRLARISHAHVVTVYGADLRDGRFGIWMELLSGRTLGEILKLQGAMSPREAALIGVDLCHALASIHRAGLLHRDVKANNVMREEGGRIVLMDFGSGRHIPADDESNCDLAGTPLYFAPELFTGGAPSVASDIYSLGVLLFHLVTGDYPVRGGDRRVLLEAHRRGERVALRDVRPDLPPAFVEVVERALAVAPADRYKSAGAFGGALAGLAGVPFDGASGRFTWTRMRVAIVGVAAAAVVAIAALVGRQAAPERAASVGTVAVQQAGAGSAPNGSLVPAPYQISAVLFANRDGQDVRLTAASRVAPGDKLFLTFEASRPLFLYIVNQDDAGRWYRLFPIEGLALSNPVPSGTHRFPGPMENREFFWQVTSAGGREHFFVYAAPERLSPFEELFDRLPPAEVGRQVGGVPLSARAVEVLRGIGGLAAGERSQPTANSMDELTPYGQVQPLSEGTETVQGVWARQITLQNPDK